MTRDRPNSEDDITNAVARVARALPADDPRAHVFFEERVDSRVTLASSGRRESVLTRTRGAAIAGRASAHLSEPDFLDRQHLASSWFGRGGTAPDAWNDNWVAGLESAISTAGTAAGVGLRSPTWSAKLVTFHQKVWVCQPGKRPVHDTRVGSRLELRAEIGVAPSSSIEELVLGAGHSPPIDEAFQRAYVRAEARDSIRSSPRPGRTSAVFAPGVGGIVVHELIGHALEGDVVARGTTWIRAAGLPVAPRPLTVVDDPRRGRGAWRFDDEGVAAGETILIDRGRPIGMLLDRVSAQVVGGVSTGHGRRASYLDGVRPRMGCTFIAPGTDDPEEILRSTRTGVFIRRLVGGHADPESGRATFVVSDSDRIVDGRLAEPLAAFVLEIDGREAWSSIDRVAFDLAFDTCIGSCIRDGQPIAASVGAPTIRIGVVRVSS